MADAGSREAAGHGLAASSQIDFEGARLQRLLKKSNSGRAGLQASVSAVENTLGAFSPCNNGSGTVRSLSCLQGMPMTVYVSLLRGINVGGHNKIKMDALRELYRKLGFQDPRTYIQSGNVVFGANEKKLKAKLIEDAIEKTVGFRCRVVLRTAAELRKTVKVHPFATRDDIDPAKLLVSFLADAPTKQALAALQALPHGPEELHIVGREIFIYFPNGMGRSKFPWASIDKILKTTATGRNLRTVAKLLEMAEELEATLA